jgi:diguanylate cyclase (GGDEF)-like protein
LSSAFSLPKLLKFFYGRETVMLRLAVSAGAFVLYLFLFLRFVQNLGLPVVILSAIPAILAGFLVGIPAGVFLALLLFPINIWLLSFVGFQTGTAFVQSGGILGTLATVMLSIGAGALRNLLHSRRLEITALRAAEHALSRSERRFRDLFENSPIALWEEDFSEVKRLVEEKNRDHPAEFNQYLIEQPDFVSKCVQKVKILDVNNRTLEMYGASSKEELLSKLGADFTPDSFDIFREELIAIAGGETVFRSEGQNVTLGGETIDIDLLWTVAPGHEDTLDRVLVSMIDITARKAAESIAIVKSQQIEAVSEISRELSDAGLNLDEIFDRIAERVCAIIGDTCVLAIISDDKQWLQPVAFHHRDAEGTKYLDELSQNAPQRIGEGSAGVVAQTGESVLIAEYQQDQPQADLPEAYKSYLERHSIHSLLIVPLLLGGEAIGTLGISRDEPGNPYVDEDKHFLQSIADRCALAIANARLHQQVEAQARTDELTGLFNRRYFLELGERELNRAKRYELPLSAIMIDIDHFKKVNDTHGHSVGDEVLREVSQRLTSHVRETDILSRYGGEEFAVVLPETGIEGAGVAAVRLHSSIRDEKMRTSAGELPITISLGIAEFSKQIASIASLLDHADSALYDAKEAGRDRINASS